MSKAKEILEEMDQLDEISDEVKAARKAERAEAVKFSKELKKKYEKQWGIKLKSRVMAMTENPFIEIEVAAFGKDKVPNEFRAKLVKLMGGKPNNEEDVNYGNVQSSGITLHFSQWKELKL